MLIALKNIAAKLQMNRNPLFTYCTSKQRRYIAKLGQPKNDIERSYFQYKCQMKLKSVLERCVFNIASFILLVPYLVRTFCVKNDNKVNNCDAVFFSNDMPRNILPDELKDEYPNINYSSFSEKHSINKKDLRYIYSIVKKHPFAYHFMFKCIVKIAVYSNKINECNPKAIIAYSEYSFTSSVLTGYCEMRGVEHINIQHGEKFYYMRDSFFRFHRFYVWDNHYIKLFEKLGADMHQFIVAIPRSLLFDKDYVPDEAYYDFIYYLAGENSEELKRIIGLLSQLCNKGLNVAVRPHPRYTDIAFLTKIANGVEIQDNKSVTIEQSLLNTKNAVSLFSTVLYQAYMNHINIVIDDVTDKGKYHQLGSIEYILLSIEHGLVSKFLQEDN